MGGDPFWNEMVEGEAAWLLRDFDSMTPPSATTLARHHLGSDAIRLHRHRTHDAALGVDEAGAPIVLLRPGLSSVRRREAICHELAEWRLRQLDCREPDVEQRADQLGAALVAPRAAFRSAVARVGPRFDVLARAFIATETLVALRYGEVTGRPLVVVTPRRLHVRGEENGWPPEPELRALAKTRRLPRGVAVARLTDDPRRSVLVAS